MKRIFLIATTSLLAAGPALADVCDPSKAICAVPEIDAGAGAAALAALGASVALLWERRRRRA